MFKGTTNRTAKDISEEVDNEGGMINAYTSRDTTCYYIQMLSNKVEKGVEILSDMFANSTFTEENLEKERNDKFPLSGLVIHRGWLYQPGIFYSRKYIRMF